MKRIFSLVLVSLMALSMTFAIPFSVSAASTSDADELFDLGKNSTLTVSYHSDDADLAGTAIMLYRVAKWSPQYKLALADDFADCGFDPEKIETNDQWLTVADTLDAFVMGNSPAVFAQVDVNDEGLAEFVNLEPGLYFIPELNIVEENGIRTFTSVIVNLPDLNNGAWNYEVTTAPKSETYTPTYKDVTYFITVVWDDKGYEKYRPASVVAHVTHTGKEEPAAEKMSLRSTAAVAPKAIAVNGLNAAASLRLLSAEDETPAVTEVPSDVTITPAMNWHYEWTTKDDGTVWNVTGSNVPHYKLTVKTVENGWILEYHIAPPPTPSPATGEDFPWLAIVLLSVSGIALVTFGVVSRRRAHD